MNKSLILSLFLVIATAATYANAEEPKPKKIENAEYLSISYIDFKPGKTSRALEILRQHYLPASKASGTPQPEVVILHSGEWDMIMTWKLERGYSQMEWEMTEEGIKWMMAFMKQEGEDKAKEIREEYRSLVLRSKHEIGYRVTDLK